MWGVCSKVLPANENSSERTPSHTMLRMFGRLAGAG